MTVNKRQTRTKSTTTRANERKQRIPLSGDARNILAIQNKDPNYVYRWVNDKPGRIERFKLAGYELVTHDCEVGERTVESADNPDSQVTKKVGGGTIAYAMRKRKDWHEEDMAAKEKAVDDTEESMFRSLNKDKEDNDSNYGKVVFERK